MTQGDGMPTDEFQADDFSIAHACMAGLNFHKLQITTTEANHRVPLGRR